MVYAIPWPDFREAIWPMGQGDELLRSGCRSYDGSSLGEKKKGREGDWQTKDKDKEGGCAWQPVLEVDSAFAFVEGGGKVLCHDSAMEATGCEPRIALVLLM